VVTLIVLDFLVGSMMGGKLILQPLKISAYFAKIERLF
jgi:hypothetical protein